MQNKKYHFLLDMDGVLVDFISGVLSLLNKKFKKSITIEEYVEKYGWSVNEPYNISEEKLWQIVKQDENFWISLSKYEWTDKLFNFLKTLGDVTIITSPIDDPKCVLQKLQWLKKNLGISSRDVFVGPKKYLMAGNGILVDDYSGNTKKFEENGGKAILVPSNWNTKNLTFDMIKQTIIKNL